MTPSERVEVLREAQRIAEEHDCNTWAECCDCRSAIAREIEALIAATQEQEADSENRD
jgi:hypothetical protein